VSGPERGGDQPRRVANLPLHLARASGHDDNHENDRDYDDSDPLDRAMAPMMGFDMRQPHRSLV